MGREKLKQIVSISATKLVTASECNSTHNSKTNKGNDSQWTCNANKSKPRINGAFSLSVNNVDLEGT